MTLILRHYKAPKHDPARDALYLAWMRKLPCLVCGSLEWIEAAHVGEHGLSRKCPDKQSLPMCPLHHRTGEYSHHTLGRNFWAHWKLDRFALIASYNLRYEGEEADVTTQV